MTQSIYQFLPSVITEKLWGLETIKKLISCNVIRLIQQIYISTYFMCRYKGKFNRILKQNYDRMQLML